MTHAVETPVAVRLEQLDEGGQSLLFTDARTANAFDPTPVSDEELQSIWDLAKWPPTAVNAQPLRVLFVRTDDGRQRLSLHMHDFNKQKVLGAPAIAVLAEDTQFHDHIPNVFPIRPQLKEHFASNDQMRGETARFNATLQAGYFILAARARGLAAGPMAGFDTAGVDKEFFPDGRFHSLLVVNLGHPTHDAFFPRQPRLEHEHVVSWA